MKSYSDAAREEMQAAQRKKELDQKEEFDRIEESLEQGRRDRMAGAELKFQQAMAALKTNASRTTREEALQARAKNEWLGFGNDKVNWERRIYENELRNLKFKARLATLNPINETENTHDQKLL